MEVLVEEPSESEKGAWRGRTYLDAPEVDGTVTLKGSGKRKLSPGEFVAAKITGTDEYDLVGQLMEPPLA